MISSVTTSSLFPKRNRLVAIVFATQPRDTQVTRFGFQTTARCIILKVSDSGKVSPFVTSRLAKIDRRSTLQIKPRPFERIVQTGIFESKCLAVAVSKTRWILLPWNVAGLIASRISKCSRVTILSRSILPWNVVGFYWRSPWISKCSRVTILRRSILRRYVVGVSTGWFRGLVSALE